MKSFSDLRITTEVSNIPETKKAAFGGFSVVIHSILKVINSEIIPIIFFPVVRLAALCQQSFRLYRAKMTVE